MSFTARVGAENPAAGRDLGLSVRKAGVVRDEQDRGCGASKFEFGLWPGGSY